MTFQSGFFDVENRIEKIKDYNSPLLKLSEYVDFNFFRSELEKYFRKGKDYSKEAARLMIMFLCLKF